MSRYGTRQDTVERGRIDEYARRSGLFMVPTVLDGNVCVKLLSRSDWIANAQFV